MKKYFIFPIFWIFSYYASAQTFEWGKTFGGESDDVVRNMIADDAGNSFTTGYFSHTAHFGEGSNQVSVSSNGLSDIFLSKINPQGEVVWVKSFGGLDNDYANGISLDNDGNIYLTGAFQQTVNFNPGGNGGLLVSNGFHDMFILKLDPEGNFIWVKSIGSPDYEESISISADISGNVYLTGYYFSAIDFDPSDGEFIMNSSGNGDAFILKLNPNGEFQWAKKIGGEGSAYGKSVKTLENGNILALGEFSGNCDLNPNAEELIINSAGKDIYLVQLDESGNFLDAYHSSSSLPEEPGNAETTRLDIDSDGNIYVIGSIFGKVNFDPENNQELFTISPESFFYNGFVLKLSSEGIPQWVKKVGGSSMVFIYDVAVFEDKTYFTGYFNADAIFDGISINQQSDNFMDAFVAEIDSDGQFISAYPFGGSGGPDGHDVEVDALGNIYLASSFHQTVDIDPLEGEFNVTVLGEDGYRDIYIIKLNPENLSVNELETGDKLIIYPNPAADVIYLKGNNNIINKGYTIYNLAGQKLKNGTVESSEKIDLTNLNSGMYILKLNNGQSFKIIKK
ncbi:SBBP repeat-containing protein [Moheibacter sediminis]|uniref:Por secretion system C-terminal sorting domain-containing protein n=1 Tax=Moheibacter sediminis TaxID=1434700 RepID=A0A1W2CG77_9FLAO|nr:SBBP repeat-containing protein [Moheibacter sediminis]SMC84171.1 Por secretion system C-terminal sorting domain-containing protein [Moheibacter sediminis]